MAGAHNMEYDAEKDKWKSIAVRERRFRASCAVFNGQCVVVGGYVVGRENYCVWTRTAESFDRRLDNWSLFPPMKAGRQFPGLLPMGNKLYVIAGAKGLHSDTHEVYDCLTKQFTFIAPSLPGCIKKLIMESSCLPTKISFMCLIASTTLIVFIKNYKFLLMI